MVIKPIITLRIMAVLIYHDLIWHSKSQQHQLKIETAIIVPNHRQVEGKHVIATNGNNPPAAAATNEVNVAYHGFK